MRLPLLIFLSTWLVICGMAIYVLGPIINGQMFGLNSMSGNSEPLPEIQSVSGQIEVVSQPPYQTRSSLAIFENNTLFACSDTIFEVVPVDNITGPWPSGYIIDTLTNHTQPILRSGTSQSSVPVQSCEQYEATHVLYGRCLIERPMPESVYSNDRTVRTGSIYMILRYFVQTQTGERDCVSSGGLWQVRSTT